MTLDPVRLQTLVLARAQTSSKPMTAAAIAKDLARFAPVEGAEWNEAIAAAIAALQAERLLDDKRKVLDRDALAKRLDGSSKRKWQQLVERLIPALGLGLAGKDAFPSGKKQILEGRDGWAAAIVGRALSLWTEGLPPTATALRDLLVWQRLGLPGKPKALPDEVRAHFLQLELNTSPGPSDRLLRILAATTLDVQSQDFKVWRNALGQRWLTRRELGGAKREDRADDDRPVAHLAASAAEGIAPPASFLDDLRRAALAVPDSGRFGERKIFLAAAWDELRRFAAWSELSLADFKVRVLAAHLAGDVSLARADLVGAMDPQLVERSEVTTAAGDAVHFLLRPEARTV